MRCSYEAINVSTRQGEEERNDATTREQRHHKHVQAPEKTMDSFAINGGRRRTGNGEQVAGY